MGASTQRRVWDELKRRKVLRVAAVYVIGLVAVLEAADLILPALYFPDWAYRLLVVAGISGFPIALALAWVYDITPRGVRRTDAAGARAGDAAGDGSVDAAGARPVDAAGARAGDAAGARPGDAAGAGRWTPVRLAVLGAAVLLAVSSAAMVVTWRGAPRTVANRIAVVPFENRTGDPALDALGMIAADWIADGLTLLQDVEVVPATAVLEVVSAAGASADLTAALVRERRTRLVITGSIDAAGDSVRVRAQLVDAGRGTILAAVRPTASHRSEPTAGLGAVREQALALVATRLDPTYTELPFIQPPTYEAYRAYVTGLELFNAGLLPEAIAAFDQARSTDASFYAPLIRIVMAYSSLGAFAPADSVLDMLEAYRDRVLPVERVIMDWMRANLRGDLATAYALSREAYRRAPDSQIAMYAAVAAYATNRPAEAVELFDEVDRPWRLGSPGVDYYSDLAASLHRLGNHRRELQVAREAREHFPNRAEPVFLEARALAGLGRVDDAVEAVAELLAQPADPPGSGRLAPTAMALSVGDALAFHGRTETARRVYARVADVSSAGGPQEGGTGLSQARALVRLGRLDEAREATAALRATGRASLALDYLDAVIAARSGDPAPERSCSRRVPALRRPWHFRRTVRRPRRARRRGTRLAAGHTGRDGSA
jgi:TolB-like protein/tetratricopeptide (TPR) repeat protein